MKTYLRIVIAVVITGPEGLVLSARAVKRPKLYTTALLRKLQTQGMPAMPVMH